MEIKNLAQPNQGSTGQGEAQALLTSAPILRTFNFGGTIQVKLLEHAIVKTDTVSEIICPLANLTSMGLTWRIFRPQAQNGRNCLVCAVLCGIAGCFLPFLGIFAMLLAVVGILLFYDRALYSLMINGTACAETEASPDRTAFTSFMNDCIVASRRARLLEIYEAVPRDPCVSNQVASGTDSENLMQLTQRLVAVSRGIVAQYENGTMLLKEKEKDLLASQQEINKLTDEVHNLGVRYQQILDDQEKYHEHDGALSTNVPQADRTGHRRTTKLRNFIGWLAGIIAVIIFIIGLIIY